MAREINDRKKRAALRKLRKAAALAEAGLGPPLSDWEVQFLDEVEARIEEYGSAFADPTKGSLEEPLSALQAHKLKEIDKKSRGKDKKKNAPSNKRSSFRKNAPSARKYGRDINEDIADEAIRPIEPDPPALRRASDLKEPQPPRPEGGFKPRLIKGGKSED